MSPASGAHWASRALQKNSRSESICSRQCVESSGRSGRLSSTTGCLARREPGLVERERGHLTEPAYLPEEQDEERWDDCDEEYERFAPAPRDEVREQRADDEE